MIWGRHQKVGWCQRGAWRTRWVKLARGAKVHVR